MASTSTKPTQAWCCTARWDETRNSPVLETLAGGDHNSWQKQGHDTSYDLTISGDWMEWIEASEDRGKDPGGAGAYDTMRCDLIVKQPGGTVAAAHKIWDQDYHLTRLVNSFGSLLDKIPRHGLPETAVKDAQKISDTMIQALLKEAEVSSFLKFHSLDARGEKEDQEVRSTFDSASKCKSYPAGASICLSVCGCVPCVRV